MVDADHPTQPIFLGRFDAQLARPVLKGGEPRRSAGSHRLDAVDIGADDVDRRVVAVRTGLEVFTAPTAVQDEVVARAHDVPAETGRGELGIAVDARERHALARVVDQRARCLTAQSRRDADHRRTRSGHRRVVEVDEAGPDFTAEPLVGVVGRGAVVGAERTRTGEAVVVATRLEKERPRAVTIAGALVSQAQLRGLGGGDFEIHAERVAALIADIATRELIHMLAVEVVVAPVDAAREPIREAPSDARAEVALIGVEARRCATGGGIADPLGHKIDGTRVGVAAIQRALRAADDLDALDIVHVETLDGALVIDAVDEIRCAGLDRGVGAGEHAGKTTDHGTLGGAPEDFGEHESGGELRDIVERGDLPVGDVCRRQRGDGQRHILQRFFALTSGDHHFFEGRPA